MTLPLLTGTSTSSAATPSLFPRPSHAENSGLCATPIPNRTFATPYVSRPFLSHARSDLRPEFVADRHRAVRSAPCAGSNSPTNRRASPVQTHELTDRACAEVALHRGSAARCAISLGDRFGGHRRARLAPENSLAYEWSTASRGCGTLMRHFFSADPVATPTSVAALALGMTVPATSRLLISTPRRSQRFVSGEAAAARAAVLLSAITNRADEYLAPTPGTQEQSGVVHRSPRRGGLDDPQSPGNTALGAVRKCGSGRSLGH